MSEKIYVIVYVESQGDYRESIFEFKVFEGNEDFQNKQTAEEYILELLNDPQYIDDKVRFLDKDNIHVIVGREKPFTLTEKVVEKVSINV